MSMMKANPLGMRGIEFVEFANHKNVDFHGLFTSLGFSKVGSHRRTAVADYTQGDIRFFLNSEPGSFAACFATQHGPSVSSIGLRFENAEVAFSEALRRGAKAYVPSAAQSSLVRAPAVYGVGESLIYFIDRFNDVGGLYDREFTRFANPEIVPTKGFSVIDHLTNNVAKGELGGISGFYKEVLGFTEVRAFDIDGMKTGLYSYALRSPCGTFCIPINEDKGSKGQIAEYLNEYRGAGVQHIAFLSDDLLSTLDHLERKVPTLDIDDDYYAEVFTRVPGVKESHERIRSHNVLVDGDEHGYLLQIFTKNCIGPIFFEFIQRRNHLSFGEGNFGALFRSIERDQERRGVI